jgi:hypothetical protein
MVKLSHHDYRFWCANGAFHHHNSVLTLKRHHNLCTNLPPLRLSKSLSESLPAQVVRAWRCCARLLVSMLQVGPRLGEHVRSGADRSHLIEEGIVGGSSSTNSSTIMRPLKCQNIEDQTTRASVMGS